MCKILLALPLVGALVLSLVGPALPNTHSDPTPRDASVASLPHDPDVARPPARTIATPVIAAPEPLPPPGHEQPSTHTMTIFNGARVRQATFVWQGGAWRGGGDFDHYDVFFRDGPRSPWRYYGTYRSPGRAEGVAFSLRANGNLALVRPHCA